MLCICVVCGRVREKSITQTIRRLETFCSIHDHIYGHRALLFWALILLSTSIFLPKGYDFNMTRPDSSNPINHQIVTQGSPRYACTYGLSACRSAYGDDLANAIYLGLSIISHDLPNSVFSDFRPRSHPFCSQKLFGINWLPDITMDCSL